MVLARALCRFAPQCARVRQAAADFACAAQTRLAYQAAVPTPTHEGVAHDQSALRLYPWLRVGTSGNAPSLSALPA